MNYLIKLILLLFIIFISKNSYSNVDNKIIFSLNEKIYSSVDLNNRIKYLENLNNIDLSISNKIEIIEDYIETIIFFEYAKNNKDILNLIKKNSELFLDKLKEDKSIIFKILSENDIKKNIFYDFSRKIVLENILDNYREYIFNNSKDTNFIYNISLDYITINKDQINNIDEFENILNKNNYNNINNYIKEKQINIYFKNIKITEFNKINNKIKNLISENKKYTYEKNLDFYRIIKVNKKLEIIEGVYYKLLSAKFNTSLNKNQENCNYIKKINVEKTIKEYEYNKLNDKIKDNLITINDFIYFNKNNIFNYIFLCEIRIDEKYLEEININKKINNVVKNIELDFITKYSKFFNLKKYYE